MTSEPDELPEDVTDFHILYVIETFDEESETWGVDDIDEVFLDKDEAEEVMQGMREDNPDVLMTLVEYVPRFTMKVAVGP